MDKALESFSNDLSLSKTFGDHHDVTLGLYTSSFSSDDWWSLGNPIAVENAQNGEVLANVTPSDIAAAGGDAGFRFGLTGSGDARVTALYLADSIQATDALAIDLGVRYEEIDINYIVDTGPGFADGVTDVNTSVDGDEVALTAAVNYTFSDSLGAFFRYSDGFRFPSFDNLREGQNQVNDVEQFEGGLKYTGENYNIYATVYRNSNDSFSSAVGSVVANAAFETESIGLEIDGKAYFGAFNLGLTAALQNAEIINSTTASDIGNDVLRQPNSQVRFSSEYNFQLGSGEATIYGAAAFVGDRFGDNGNTVVLPSYEKLDLGLKVGFESGLFTQLHVDNLTDSDGITEGDPRNPSAPNGRPILGRSVKLSIGYDF